MKKHLKALLIAICATVLVVLFACIFGLFFSGIPTWLAATIFFLSIIGLMVSFYSDFIKDDNDD